MTPDPPVCFQRGEYATIQHPDGLSPSAFIALASPNGHSLMVMGEFVLGGCVGMAPLLWNEGEGAFYTLTGYGPLTLTRRESV